MEIFVLRKNAALGPFDEQEILDKVERGELSEDDLVMIEGLHQWTTLRSVIVREGAEPSTFRISIDNWVNVAEVSSLNLRSVYDTQPLGCGIIALVLCCLMIILWQWPIFLYGPFFLVAISAGILLIRRQRYVPGILFLALAIIIPGALRQLIFHRMPDFGSMNAALYQSTAIAPPHPGLPPSPPPTRPAPANPPQP